MKTPVKIKLSIISFCGITMLINVASKNNPQFVETYYSNSVNKLTRQILSLLTSLFKFSIAEFLVSILFIVLIASIILLAIKIKKGGLFNHSLSILAYLSALYILFMFLWGFNYNRLSFDKIAGLKIEQSSKQELYYLCEELIKSANTLREAVPENSHGVMAIPGGYKDVLKRASKGYDIISKLYPELGGKYGPPKYIIFSEKMSYTGITGVYIPYTGEPNVNVNTTDLMLPCTTAHEMAHQRGFSREDEANYISYLACRAHPDLDFKYSGIMLALIESMNALASHDIEGYKVLAGKYSKAVRRDLQYENAFWAKYKGKIDEISNKVNDTYLKSNGQEDGVASYGRVVDLLLAEYRTKNLVK